MPVESHSVESSSPHRHAAIAALAVGRVLCSQPPPTAVGCTDSGSHSKSQRCDAVAAEHGAQPHGCPIGAKDPMGPAVPGRSRKDVPGRSVLCCPVCPTDVFDF